jgi:hypothetical protein
MQIRQFLDRSKGLWSNRRGVMETQTALLFAGVSLAVAVLAAPMLQRAVDGYAQYRALGVDRVLTGSVSGGPRLTIRRSVLEEKPTVICGAGSRQVCPSR